jgi:fatty acid-binding protein DegV
VSKFKFSLTRALDSGPSLYASQKENKKRIKTSHTQRASCPLQLQGRVSKLKLSLTRASDSCPSLDASQKENKKRIKTSHTHRANCQLQLQGRMSKIQAFVKKSFRFRP